MTHLQLRGDFQEHSGREDYLLIYGKILWNPFSGSGYRGLHDIHKGTDQGSGFYLLWENRLFIHPPFNFL